MNSRYRNPKIDSQAINNGRNTAYCVHFAQPDSLWTQKKKRTSTHSKYTEKGTKMKNCQTNPTTERKFS